MTLPVSFDDTSYFAYGGDLIVTHGVIYYFPHSHLTNPGNKTLDRWNEMTQYGGLLFLLFDWIMIRATRSQPPSSINSPHIKKDGLWREGDSSESLRQRLDAYIDEMKKRPRQPTQFGAGLPLPMRFDRTDITGLSVKSSGALKFYANYDHHEFVVNPALRTLLEMVLKEGGFLS